MCAICLVLSKCVLVLLQIQPTFGKLISRNALLRAMDSRLTALRSELIAAFNQAVGETCSYKEITHLAEFSANFGANDLK